MFLDAGESDISADADALAMKYLSDEQLSQLAKLRLHTPTAARSLRRDTGLSRVFVDNASSPNSQRSSDVSTYGIPMNHMSFASRKYLKRYGLLEEADDRANGKDPHHAATENDNIEENEKGKLTEMNVRQFLERLAISSNRVEATPCIDQSSAFYKTSRDDTWQRDEHLSKHLKRRSSPAFSSATPLSHLDNGSIVRRFDDASLTSSLPERRHSAMSDMTTMTQCHRATPSDWKPHSCDDSIMLRQNWDAAAQSTPLPSHHRQPRKTQTPAEIRTHNTAAADRTLELIDGVVLDREKREEFDEYVRRLDDKPADGRVLDIERLKELPKLM